MQAYEFNTIVHEGIIRIPEQYRNEQLSSVKVILLSNPAKTGAAAGKKKFTAMQLKTKGFTFNREESNER